MLSDEQLIRNALAVYCRALDDERYEDLSEIFDDDTVYELTGGPYRGVAESVAGLRSLMSTLPRKRHISTNTHITLKDVTALVISDWFSVNVLPGRQLEFAAGGRWVDDFEKRGDRWVITHRRIERL